MRMKKRKRAEPPPLNAFPDVVTKGLVTEDEARELYNTSALFSSLPSSLLRPDNLFFSQLLLGLPSLRSTFRSLL